jgi:hypothetical protein
MHRSSDLALFQAYVRVNNTYTERVAALSQMPHNLGVYWRSSRAGDITPGANQVCWGLPV